MAKHTKKVLVKPLLLMDFDGVIVNTFELAYKIKHDMDPDLGREEYRARFDGNIYAAKGKNPPTHHGRIPHFIKPGGPFFKRFIPGLLTLPPKAGMKQVLRRLAKQYSIVVISSTLSRPIATYLRLHGMRNDVEQILGPEVEQDKVRKMKRVLKEYKASAAQTVLITDTLGDIREARKAGVNSIAVTWGYQRLETLKRGRPLKIVRTPGQLEKVLL